MKELLKLFAQMCIIGSITIGLMLIIASIGTPKECQCIDLPSNVLIHEENQNGVKIYWIEFDKIGKIKISSSNAKAYKAGKITLQLVKWYDELNGTYIYTIRRKKGNKLTTNIDLLTIFEE